MDSLISALGAESIHHANRLFAAIGVGPWAHSPVKTQRAPHLGFDIGDGVIVRAGGSFSHQGHFPRLNFSRRLAIF